MSSLLFLLYKMLKRSIVENVSCVMSLGDIIIEWKAPKRFLYVVHTSWAVLFPLPAKNDTVSHSLCIHETRRISDLTGPSAIAIRSVVMYQRRHPVLYATLSSVTFRVETMEMVRTTTSANHDLQMTYFNCICYMHK